MSKPTIRRVFAYLFDFIIITIIASAFNRINILNPYFEKYEEAFERYDEYITEMTNDPVKMSEEFSIEEMLTVSYDLDRYGVYTSIITLGVTFLYFVGFQYITHGKTAGKLIMGIEVVSTDKKPLNIRQLLLRSAIINSLLPSLILILMITFMSKQLYIKTSVFVELIHYGLLIACFAMAVYREDGLALHDKIAKTRVILSRDKELLKEENKKTRRVKKVK